MEVQIYQGGKTLVQRGGGCPILGNIQGQVGHGSEQPFLVEDVPAHGSRVRPDGFQRLLLTQTLWVL